MCIRDRTLGNATLLAKGTVTVGVDGTGHDVKFFGCEAGAYMLYDESEEQLEIRGAAADAATSTGKLLLSTALTNINACDVIGSINFQAPAEAGGTDAVAIAAGIRAVAQATFTCAVNATDLIFYTGHSEAATEKFRFTSQGEIGIGGANYGSDGQVLTSAGAGAAVAWECVSSGRSVAGDTDNGIITWVTSDNTFAAEASLTYDGTTLTIPGQIAFPASQSASSGGNTLDDYEEGSWTPALADCSNDGSGEGQAYGTQVGRYTKIGNLVHVQFKLVTTDLGTLCTSRQARVVGLPFTSKNEANANSVISVGSASGLAIDADESVIGAIIQNVAYIELGLWESTTGADAFRISEWSDSGNLTMAGSYRTD